MAEVRGHKKKKISINLSLFALTDNNTNSTKSSPNKFEDPNGNGVGLGIVAAMSNNNHNNNKTAILAISPRLTSNPIPILVNNYNPKNNKEEMEMCEEYTCVISHKGNNLVKKREYFDDQFIGNDNQKKQLLPPPPLLRMKLLGRRIFSILALFVRSSFRGWTFSFTEERRHFVAQSAVASKSQ